MTEGEEKQLLIGNVFEELKGKEAQVAGDQVWYGWRIGGRSDGRGSHGLIPYGGRGSHGPHLGASESFERRRSII